MLFSPISVFKIFASMQYDIHFTLKIMTSFFSAAGSPQSSSGTLEGSIMAEAPGAYSLREVEMNTEERYGFKREFRKQK